MIDKAPYFADLGITVLQLLPVQEFPGDFSLGYNGTDYYSPESAYGIHDNRLDAYLRASTGCSISRASLISIAPIYKAK